MSRAVSEHRSHPARRSVLLLRRKALARIGKALRAAGEELEIEALKAAYERARHSGSVVLGGQTPVECAGEGPTGAFLLDAEGNPIERTSAQWREAFDKADGTEAQVSGNLLWRDDAPQSQAKPEDWEALRSLLRGEGDAWQSFQALTTSAAPAKPPLDEAVVSLLLHASALSTSPGDSSRPPFAPYRSDLGRSALARLELKEPRYEAELGYLGFCRFAADLLEDDDLGLEDLSDAVYFLQRLSAGRLRAWRESLQRVRAPEEAKGGAVARATMLQAERLDSSLVVPEGVAEQAVAALNRGKHIILTGPPGTGKTTLAEDLCRLARDHDANRGHVLVTATADWTTFDTVGGYMPEATGGGDRLAFRPGVFLEAVAQSKWLVIDEINRADIDKAFGELLTVLSGQAVTLPYKRGGLPIRVLPLGCGARGPGSDIRIPDSWRIIGTMNVFDKAALFGLSYAFMRRFAFIEVPLPDTTRYQQVLARFCREAFDGQKQEPAVMEALQRLFWNTPGGTELSPLMERRGVGPAIARDMVGYMSERARSGGLTHRCLVEAMTLFLLPQLDGLEREHIMPIYSSFSEVLRAPVPEADQRELLRCVRERFPHIDSRDWPQAASAAPQ